MNGQAEAPDDIQARFDVELETFRRSDSAREELMQRLFKDNIKLHEQLDDLKNDWSNEKDSRRRWQSMVKEQASQIKRLNDRLEDNPFVLALIDGDGCIFQDRLLQLAADGGAEAAHELHQEIKHVLQDRELSPSCTVKVEIYLSLEDLSRKLASVGILNTAGDMTTFAHAFNLAQPLFSIIDVGRGKERADHKIKEMFRLFVNNPSCKQVIFGGCHDNGYLPNLEPYKRDANIKTRITLLESTPAEWAYQNLGFQIARFNSVFRSEPLPDGRRHYSPVQASTSISARPPSPSRHAFSPSANTFHPKLSSGSYHEAEHDPKASTSRRDGGVTVTYPSRPVAPAHNTSADSNNTTIIGKAPSPVNVPWAQVGGPAGSKTINIGSAKSNPVKKGILYNEHNQRIDEKLPKPDPIAENKLKMRVQQKGKLCNNWHLKGKCANGANCHYNHEPALTDGEKLAFRHRVRTTPCPRGLECPDVNCYLGHQCPLPNCMRSNCFFDELHGIDQTPVMKVFEDETLELIKT